MAPSYLDTEHTFLGWRCGAGVNPTMAERLRAVEDDIRRTHLETAPDEPFDGWCGLHEPLIGWRSGAGYHSSGSAVDINYSTVPYIVTRTGSTLGGEAAAHGQHGMRYRAVEVYDRAMAFVNGPGTTADVSIRIHDTIEFTYDRFREVSDALMIYLSWAVSTEHRRVDRRPIADVHLLPDADPRFDQIPPSERSEPQDQAIETLDNMLATDPEWSARAALYGSGAALYWQILRDYELVRIPMQYGNPTPPVTATRNPAHGFLDLRRELVVSLVAVGGMRWGASDFGARESGDVMHFDLGGHADYQPE